MITRLWAVAWRAHVILSVLVFLEERYILLLVSSGACRTRCRASMFWEVHPPGVPTVHLRPTSLRKKQTRALCWRKSTSAGCAEWLIQLWSRTLLPTRLDGNNSSLYETRGPRLGLLVIWRLIFWLLPLRVSFGPKYVKLTLFFVFHFYFIGIIGPTQS